MWNRIKCHEGETFHTVSGLPFTYKVIDDNTIRPYRDDKPMWNITIENLEKALTMLNAPKADFNRTIFAPAYTRALLLDPRININQ